MRTYLSSNVSQALDLHSYFYAVKFLLISSFHTLISRQIQRQKVQEGYPKIPLHSDSLQLHLGGSQGVHRPQRINNSFCKFWVCTRDTLTVGHAQKTCKRLYLGGILIFESRLISKARVLPFGSILSRLNHHLIYDSQGLYQPTHLPLYPVLTRKHSFQTAELLCLKQKF